MLRRQTLFLAAAAFAVTWSIVSASQATVAPLSASSESATKTKGSFWSGFIASLSVVVVSELGDKTFFIAAIMAMKHPRFIVFGGAISALVFMTVLSAAFGSIATFIPRAYTIYISAALFAIFGLKMLYDGWRMKPNEGQEELEEVQTELKRREDQSVQTEPRNTRATNTDQPQSIAIDTSSPEDSPNAPNDITSTSPNQSKDTKSETVRRNIDQDNDPQNNNNNQTNLDKNEMNKSRTTENISQASGHTRSFIGDNIYQYPRRTPSGSHTTENMSQTQDLPSRIQTTENASQTPGRTLNRSQTIENASQTTSYTPSRSDTIENVFQNQEPTPSGSQATEIITQTPEHTSLRSTTQEKDASIKSNQSTATSASTPASQAGPGTSKAKSQSPREEKEETLDMLEQGQAERRRKRNAALKVFIQAATLTFLAEWGDRSQLATVVLATSEDAVGVVVGGSLGHSLCTGLAVVGGRIVAQKISVRTVTIIGGVVFLFFSVSTLIMGP